MRSGRFALLPVLLVALAACGSSADPWEGTQLDASGWRACTNLTYEIGQAGGAQVTAALPVSSRAPFTTDVVAPAGRSSSPGMADAAAAVAARGDGPAVLWADALGKLATKCTSLGYKPE